MRIWTYLGGLAVSLALAFGLASAGPAKAQTVDEIISRGTINIGVLVDLPPYGILNAQQEPDGYDIEVAKLLGKYLGVKVNLVQLTSPNRIPFLVTNKVDLIVATFGVTPERAKQVLFSIPYSAIENVVFGPKDQDHQTVADLKGLRVGVPRGTVQDVILTRRSATMSRWRVSMTTPPPIRRCSPGRSTPSPRPASRATNSSPKIPAPASSANSSSCSSRTASPCARTNGTCING